MAWKSVSFVVAIFSASLSLSGCLDRGAADPAPGARPEVTILNAQFSPEGEATRVSGTSDGDEVSYLASKVVFEDAAAAPGGEANIVQCYKCICTENVCLCRPVDCAE